MLGMFLEVVVGSIRNTLKLPPSPRIIVLNVKAAFCVVGQLVWLMRAQAEFGRVIGVLLPPLHAHILPVFKPLIVGSRLTEELHFHLLEFTRPKNKMLNGDFVAKRLAHLGDAKGYLQ